jgi:hypothetical protein
LKREGRCSQKRGSNDSAQDDALFHDRPHARKRTSLTHYRKYIGSFFECCSKLNSGKLNTAQLQALDARTRR